MRLPNIKMLLHWPSRMHIYGFVENRTFLEQFVSMGVPAHFSILWSNLIAWGVPNSELRARRGSGFQCHKTPIGQWQISKSRCLL